MRLTQLLIEFLVVIKDFIILSKHTLGSQKFRVEVCIGSIAILFDIATLKHNLSVGDVRVHIPQFFDLGQKVVASQHGWEVLSERSNHKATERGLEAPVCQLSDHHKARSPFDTEDVQRAAGDALVLHAELLNDFPVLMANPNDHSTIHLRIMQMSIVDATSITDGGAEGRLIEQSASLTGAKADDSIGGAHGVVSFE
jgi:hypothetical protein